MKRTLLLLPLLIVACCTHLQAQSGRVFQDKNGNGVQDTGEPGVAGITIKSFTPGDALKGTAVSDSLGNYTLTPAAGATQKLRIEFSIPATLSQYKPAFNGSVYGSQVQFVTGPAANRNFAVTSRSAYVAATCDPVIVHSRYIFGNQVTGQFKDSCVLFGFRNSWGTSSNASGNYSHWNTNAPYRIATAKEVGSVYGIVYSKKRKAIFTSAFFRQFSGFGPGGPGAIYKIPYNMTTGNRTAAPSLLVDVTTLSGQNMAADPHGTDIPVNWVSSPVSTDARMALVGKYSLGDMEISEDESKLYAVNLANREIIAINPDNGSLLSRWSIPTTSLTNSLGNVNPNDVRPFGLGYKNGTLYVGAVVTGQSTQSNNGTAAGAAGNNNALHAYVWSLNENTGNFTLVLDFKIKDKTPGCYTWQDSWLNGVRKINPTADVIDQPQPILSDIDFYGNDIILGFRNRANDQWPISNYDAAIGANAYTQKWGDILGGRFVHATGKFIAESAGTIGSRAATGTPGITSGYNEFYRGDGTTTSGWDYGFENASGSLVQVGANNLVSLQNFPGFSMNTWPDSDQGGATWMNNETGAASKAYASFLGDMFNCVVGKSNGLGGIEAVVDIMPIEVGNRVWNDANGNGIQDGDEVSYANVTLDLYDAAGLNKLATTTTNSNGEYSFNNGNVSGGLQPYTTYRIRIGSTQFSGSGGIGVLSGTVLTPAGITTAGAPGVADNDGVDVLGKAEILFTTGDWGDNNYDLDFGMKSASFLSIGNITQFTAVRQRETALLQWTTNFEKDLACFEIERSTDGTNWQPMGRVTARGNSQVPVSYTFTDVFPRNGVVNLYRLRQVGTDAEVHYSEIRSVRFNNNTAGIGLFPNPAANRFTLNLSEETENQPLTINLVNSAGQTVQQNRIARATRQESISLNKLPAGAYRVVAIDGNSKKILFNLPIQILP